MSLFGPSARTASLVVCFSGLVFAQATPSAQLRARAERSTLDLLTLHAQATTARAADRARAIENLVAKAVERQALLAALVAADPGSALALALSPDLRASLPPEARAWLETDEDLEGTVEVLVEDHDRGWRLHHFLRGADGSQVALHFDGTPPGWQHGQRVRVRGMRVGAVMALKPGGGTTTGSQPASTILPNTFGEQRTLVILVNFQDNAVQPYSLAHAQNVTFGTTSNFDLEASSHQTWLTGDVGGWFTLPLSSAGCDYGAIQSAARTAASNAGVNLGGYARFVYAFPKNGCNWWGLGNVGGNPSNSWINGTYSLKVLAHEMGHNFGLYHAQSLDCGATAIGETCTATEYGDTIDMMGLSAAGHFTAFAKERMGWLGYGSSPPVTTVTSSGTYVIEPYATLGTGSKALKLLKSGTTAGSRTWYYVEYRHGSGFDGFLSANANVANGVVVHTGSESSPNSSYLLDMTPASSSWTDPALVAGQTFTDAAAGVTLSVVSVGSGGATVNVQVASQQCVRSAPTMSFSPNSLWTTAGATSTVTVTVTNRDGAGCPASTFALSSGVPAGWLASFLAPTLIVPPGAAASSSMSLVAAADAVEASYPVSVTATSQDVPLTATATMTALVVNSGPQVSASTDRSAYSRNQTAQIRGGVTASGQPLAGLTVSFTVTRSDGSAAHATATTDASGRTAIDFRIRPKDPKGTYTVDVRTTIGGLAGSATTTFTVQ